MTDAPVLALLGNSVCEMRDVLEAGLESDWLIEEWCPGDDSTDLLRIMSRATAAVTGGDALMAGGVMDAVGKAPNLKFLQLPFTGYEWLDLSLVPRGVQVANAYGHEVAMAEWVMGAMLLWEKQYARIDADFRGGSWKYRAVGVTDLQMGELSGKTLGIIGYGKIGEELAKRANAFDMTTIAVSRSDRITPEPLEWFGTMDRMSDLLEESDYVVVACALNDETRDLIGTKEFQKMGPDCTIMNVARGGVINEDALYLALKDRTIRGGIIDVWYKYPGANPPNPAEGGPAPSKHDFAELENVIMSPHCSANTAGSSVRRVLGIAENLDLVAKGEEPATMIGEGTKD